MGEEQGSPDTSANDDNSRRSPKTINMVKVGGVWRQAGEPPARPTKTRQHLKIAAAFVLALIVIFAAVGDNPLPAAILWLLMFAVVSIGVPLLIVRFWESRNRR